MSSPDATTALPAPLLSTPLVSTQWLADHLGRDGLVVLDATVLHVKAPATKAGYRWLSGLDQYLVDGHIPGAVFADVLEVFSDPAKPFGFARPDALQIVAAAASVGIDDRPAPSCSTTTRSASGPPASGGCCAPSASRTLRCSTAA